jgi:hypothetical protein
MLHQSLSERNVSLQTLMPNAAFQPSFLSPTRLGTGNAADDTAPSHHPGGKSPLPPEVDRLLQQLLQALTDPDAGADAAGAADPLSADAPQGSAGGGMDPQLAEMLAYIARAFEAMLAQQAQQGSGDDDGVQGIGGGGGAPVGGGAAPALAGAAPAAAPVASDAPPAASTGPAAANASTAAGLTLNEGGVAQAPAIDGVAPNAAKVVDTGTGTDRVFNITNNTNSTKSFEYETEGKQKAVITEKPGETDAIRAGKGDLGVRIESSDEKGNVRPGEQLFETGGSDNGQAAGVSNDDISNVDGNKGFDGQVEKMTDTLSDGRRAGDGDAIRPYQNPTDDAAAMGLAGDSSLTSNIVVSN